MDVPLKTLKIVAHVTMNGWVGDMLGFRKRGVMSALFM